MLDQKARTNFFFFSVSWKPHEDKVTNIIALESKNVCSGCVLYSTFKPGGSFLLRRTDAAARKMEYSSYKKSQEINENDFLF